MNFKGWFPDRTMAMAGYLTNNRAFQALSGEDISIPIGKNADALGTATAGTAAVDGHIPTAKTETVTLCARDTDGNYLQDAAGNYVPETKMTTRYINTIVRLRLVTNFSIEPAKDENSTKRDIRSVTTPEGGLANLEFSRYIYAYAENGFSFFTRVMGGVGAHQITGLGNQPAAEVTYRALGYLAGQIQGRLPIVSSGDKAPPVQLVISAEPFYRGLPDELRPTFNGKTRLFGAAGRLYFLFSNRAGLGLTYRVTNPGLPPANRFSIDVIVLR